MNYQRREKIKELFEYRHLPWLMGDLGVEVESLEEKMITLQNAIFDYDDELERNWQPNIIALETCWNRMIEQLGTMGVSEDLSPIYLSEIRQYASHELLTRSGISLLDIPFWTFYYYKSCDVRLMRRLIYKNGTRSGVTAYSDWILFDLVTEINDDVTDLKEDLGTFNGNRYLHAIVELGWESATNLYKEALKKLKDRSGRRKTPIRWPDRLVRTEVALTEELLDMNYKARDEIKIPEKSFIND